MVEIHAGSPADTARLREELTRPSLYDETLRLLARRGLPVPPAVLARDVAEAHAPDAGVEACWADVYGDTERWWDLYELAEKLTDVEHHLQLWRFGHLKIVERIIGFRKGTGGSAGVAYLAKVLEKSLFPGTEQRAERALVREIARPGGYHDGHRLHQTACERRSWPARSTCSDPHLATAAGEGRRRLP